MSHLTTTTAAFSPAVFQSASKLIPATVVRQTCGDVSDMTLFRWMSDPSKTFPKPVYIGRRRYWREVDIAAWQASRPVVNPYEGASHLPNLAQK
jgi:predicted DNA-binding transcriptional regulator AlpA